MIYVKYNTTTPLIMGPFIKSTDGYSPLTGMTSVNLTFAFWIGTAPTTGDYSTGECSGITEIGSGYYKCFFGSTMVGTIGMGKIAYTASGSSGIPIYDDYIVINANAHESLITSGDYLQVDISAAAGTTITGATAFMSSFSTAAKVNIGAVNDVAVTDINDFVCTAYAADGTRTWGEIMKAMSAYILGDSTYDGTTVVYYDQAGTTFWGAVITTDSRNVTT